MITYHNIKENEKREICSWKYGGDYEIYDLPSFEECRQKNIMFANPANEKEFYTFIDGDNLLGFVRFKDIGDELELGIGLNPKFCGKGYGAKILSHVFKIAKEIYLKDTISLTVRTWNKRAVKCYIKAGFHIDGDIIEKTTPIGKGKFYRMVIQL